VTKMKDKVQNALDEARILVLGTQVLVGFTYRAFFEEGYEELPPWAKAAALAALALLLAAFCAIATPASYHRIAARGEDREDVHAFTTAVLRFALLPLALAMGLDVAIAASRALGPAGAMASGGGAAAVSLAAWYGYTYGARARHPPHDEEPQMEPTQTKDKIKHVLTETRMVLPGAQALLGFQFAVTLMQSFEKLDEPLRLLHLGVLGLIALAVVLLMTPAAYHRIVERGEETEHFHAVASRFVLVAMVPLALALCGDLLIVVQKVTGSYEAAAIAAGVTLALFLGMWFGVTSLLARRRAKGRELPAPAPRPARQGA
jgi:Family of unknown function (DUF6328)